MMNKMEMVNNKREIAKVLNNIDDLSQAKVSVFTWLNGCWNETDGEHTQLDIMVEVFYGIGNVRNTSITWKQVKTNDEDKMLRKAFKATCELAQWVNAKYNVAIANDEWLIID